MCKTDGIVDTIDIKIQMETPLSSERKRKFIDENIQKDDKELLDKFHEKYDLKDMVDTLVVNEDEKKPIYIYTCPHCRQKHERLYTSLFIANTTASRSLCTMSYNNDKKKKVSNHLPKRDPITNLMGKEEKKLFKASVETDPCYLKHFLDRYNYTLDIKNIEVFLTLRKEVIYKYICPHCSQIHIRKYKCLFSGKYSPHNRTLCTNAYHYDLRKSSENPLSTEKTTEKIVLRLELSDTDSE